MSAPLRQPLRKGFSTGANAAAAITAAWKTLNGEEINGPLPLLFPDGETRTLPLADCAPGFARIVKDGGDDPDCTHGAVLEARVSAAVPEQAAREDYLLPIGRALLILRSGGGIGLCTLPGLDCEQHKWAINHGPRRMIADNLARAGMREGCWLAEISVRDGEKLAGKTLNPLLGVVGGISILGTSGIVRPYSHEAYIATIRICVRSTRLSGFRKAVFCTGGRTAALAKSLLPEYPSISFICIGDFIAESLQSAGEQGMTEAVVACMPGKLCKYAAGFANTHAHKVAQDMPLFLRTAERHAPLSGEARRGILACSSVRQALSLTPEEAHLSIYRDLAAEAQRQFQRHVPGLPVRFLISGFSGNLLLDIPPCHP